VHSTEMLGNGRFVRRHDGALQRAFVMKQVNPKRGYAALL
jgi:hypothetical protein